MDLKTHEQILRDALGGNPAISEWALRRIIAANKLSDLHQFARERHFDSARNPLELCALWEKGLSHFLELAVRRCSRARWGRPALSRTRRALAALGAASHALADFYAHTNWVEIHAARGEPLPLAPLTGESCTPDAFPPTLQSGYFGLRYGLDGCPQEDGQWLPPEGFRYCHAQLAKDSSDSGHGAERVYLGGPTYHALASRLAIQATRDLWESLRERIRDRYGYEIRF
jgi:hypothetical protein